MSELTQPQWKVKGSDLGDGVRLITLDSPPVNALSFALCAELVAAIHEAENDASVSTVVITGANGYLSGGADVNDLNNIDARPGPETKTARDVMAALEHGKKLYVAAIDGMALGGGCELALACDYRVATTKSRVGLPEIKLGLLPGAGGTQRLPRLIGAQDAMQLMLKGEMVKAPDALQKKILDEVVDGDVVAAAKAYAGKPKRRIAAMQAGLGIPNLGLFATPFVVAQAHKMVPPEDNGGLAAHKLIDAVQAAIELPFEKGLAREYRLFDELLASKPSAALRHIFFAERELGKVPGLAKADALPIKKAAVIGAGTMGTGIAITFASVGIPVTVVDISEEQITKARELVFGTFSYHVKKGRLTQEQAWQQSQLVSFESDYDEIKDVDIVVEAVVERMDLKRTIFQKLDATVKPEAILASNTSTLDIDEMAAQTKRPDKVVGLHFFAPANIMKLLEIVRGKDTSAQTLQTAIALGKTLKKVAVISGNAFGFIGNRMFFDYSREAIALATEGATPTRIDAVMKAAGMAMGPFATFDLSGVDVFYHIQKERPDSLGAQSSVVDTMYERKRWGQKTGGGFHDYIKGNREPQRSEEIEQLFAEDAKRLGITPREIPDDEIINRLWLALANVGADLLEKQIALRPGDEDIVFIYGYGFPPHHGGPMWYVDEIGVQKAVDIMEGYRSKFGDQWTPAPLLVDIAKRGGTIANYSKELTHA
jgi:3-hydroxyacyl-CoA dehydrogenase